MCHEHDWTGCPQGRHPSLDGLRAISIALVLAGHAIKVGPHSFAFSALCLHADLGVRTFFIISGFLITTLLLSERSQSGSISLRSFYIRRALRILPAFFLFVGCVALLSIFGVTPVPSWFWLYVLTYTVDFAPLAFGCLVISGHCRSRSSFTCCGRWLQRMLSRGHARW